MMPKRSGKVCVTDASSLFLAKRNTEHGSGLGRWRWVVERTFAWLNQFRRLRVRYEKRADIHEAFLSLGCALICWRFLRVDLVAG
jgi:transposase